MLNLQEVFAAAIGPKWGQPIHVPDGVQGLVLSFCRAIEPVIKPHDGSMKVGWIKKKRNRNRLEILSEMLEAAE